MKTMTPEQLIAGIGSFVKENREEELGQYESLYVELWKQWRTLNSYSMDWADAQSKAMAVKYWQGMASWYDQFSKVSEKLMEPQLAPVAEITNFYMDAIEESSTAVTAALPLDALQQPVVKINNFPFRLRQQVEEMKKLDMQYFTLIDLELLIGYWHVIAGLVNAEE